MIAAILFWLRNTLDRVQLYNNNILDSVGKIVERAVVAGSTPPPSSARPRGLWIGRLAAKENIGGG